jgi:hypothetical protein
MKNQVFIASSVEGLEIAYALQENLEHNAEVTVWDQGVFGLSTTIISRLVKLLDTFDFGLFVFSPDDKLLKRGETCDTVRDNIVFELGLFIGRLGMERCFIVQPADCEMHLPTDLLGFQPGTYKSRTDGNWVAQLGPVSNRIRRIIDDLGPRRPHSTSHGGDEEFWESGSYSKSDRLGSYVEARNADVARIAQEKDLVKRILNGETVKEVDLDGTVFRIGDRFPIPSSRWVKVMNLDGVENYNGKDEFGETCIIDEAGVLEILGFHKAVSGEWQALCRFHVSERRAGTSCGDGAIFFRQL